MWALRRSLVPEVFCEWTPTYMRNKRCYSIYVIWKKKLKAKDTFLNIWSNLFNTNNEFPELGTLYFSTLNFDGITFIMFPVMSWNFDIKVWVLETVCTFFSPLWWYRYKCQAILGDFKVVSYLNMASPQNHRITLFVFMARIDYFSTMFSSS